MVLYVFEVINPSEGLKQLRDLPVSTSSLSIVIQPGAGSEDIRRLCTDRNWKVFEGCVLIEFPRHNQVHAQNEVAAAVKSKL